MTSIRRTDDAWLYVVRRVKNKPVYLKGNGVSSALFKDSKGVSVDKDHGRPETDVIADEQRLHDYYLRQRELEDDESERLVAIVAVDKSVIDEKDVFVEDDPLEENEHHAILKKSRDEIALTSSQAKGLARGARMLLRS